MECFAGSYYTNWTRNSPLFNSNGFVDNCRTILAALHFNYNLRRTCKKDANDNAKLRVTYPKFKEGEATVREVREKPNYGKYSMWTVYLIPKETCTFEFQFYVGFRVMDWLWIKTNIKLVGFFIPILQLSPLWNSAVPAVIMWKILYHMHSFPILGYVAEIFSCLENSTREELKGLEEELKKDAPEPLHSLLEKQNDEEAKEKYLERKGKSTSIVPPTCTGIYVSQFATIIFVNSWSKEILQWNSLCWKTPTYYRRHCCPLVKVLK